MKEIASWALETAKLRGASLAEARIVDQRDRSLATKNGKIASASDAESMGVGIRVIAEGAFGFAATDDLSRTGVESCAARAVEIAKSSATVQSQSLRMVPEPAAKADWTSPCKIDPFGISIEEESGAAVCHRRRTSQNQRRDPGGDQHEFPPLRAMVLFERRF